MKQSGIVSRLFLAIDDTDNLNSAGTGHVLEGFRDLLAARGIETQAISRHQLYFHEDVPYTSHNSSMCTEMVVPKDIVPEIIELASGHLADSFVDGSDPGLCAACADDIPNIAALIAYGRRGKSSLLTKDEAYSLAKEQNIHLSEHGGTGDGVVGALAGVALRISGFDGRIKGKVDVGTGGEVFTVSGLLQRTGFSSVMAINGAAIRGDEKVTLSEGRIKAVRINWQSTILVSPSSDRDAFFTIPHELLKVY